MLAANPNFGITVMQIHMSVVPTAVQQETSTFQVKIPYLLENHVRENFYLW